jgi:hypothetical protein
VQRLRYAPESPLFFAIIANTATLSLITVSNTYSPLVPSTTESYSVRSSVL